MKYELPTKMSHVTDEEILDDLRKVARKLRKKTLLQEEYTKAGKYNGESVKRRLGNWNSALKRAGLEYSRSLGFVTDKELFGEIDRIWKMYKRPPTSRDMHKPISKIDKSTYLRNWGSWKNALAAFVDYMNSGGKSGKRPEGWQRRRKRYYPHTTKRIACPRLQLEVLKRDKYRCANCGKSPARGNAVDLVIDHVKAWAKGGETVLANLQTLCEGCNAKKCDK
jgi:hypothetical protein